MITENKKLIKEINTIIASSTKAMEITRQEIEKVDAKYKALADKEKADLEKLLKMQEGQISAYKSMVCFTDEPKAPAEKTANGVVEETEKEPVEEKVVDTLFPENNEEETSEEETSEDETAEDETAEPETASEPKPEAETSEWGASESEINDDDDDWGDEPEEWK